MPQIIPIMELKKTNELSEMCHKVKEPVFITKDGCNDMVIMSIETYEKKLLLNDLYLKLNEAEQSISIGKIKDGFEGLKKTREKYEL